YSTRRSMTPPKRRAQVSRAVMYRWTASRSDAIGAGIPRGARRWPCIVTSSASTSDSPRVDFRCQPEHPVPEVLVDAGQGARVDDPWRFVPVRNVWKDQVDLGGPADDEHVTGFVTQSVPLLDQGIERTECGTRKA